MSCQHIIARKCLYCFIGRKISWETGNLIRHGGADGNRVRQHLGIRHIWGCHCFCCHFNFDIIRGCISPLIVLAQRQRKPNYCGGRLTGWSMMEMPHIFPSHFVFSRSFSVRPSYGMLFLS